MSERNQLIDGHWPFDSCYVRNPGGRQVVWQGRRAPFLVIATHHSLNREWGLILACGDSVNQARLIQRLEVSAPDDRRAAQRMVDAISEAVATFATLEQIAAHYPEEP